MKGANGIIDCWRTDAFSTTARLEISVPTKDMDNINPHFPVLITNDRHMTAADLNGSHLGQRVRVVTPGGTAIEDTLTGVKSEWNDGKPRVFASFKNAFPGPALSAFPALNLGQPGFPLMPDAEVTIIKENTK